MKNWRKRDVGKVIIPENDKKKIIIYDIPKETSDLVRYVEHPILLDLKLPFPHLKSRIGILGIIKDQEKKDEGDLKEAGDWYFVEKVSKEDMKILKEVRNSPKYVK